MGGGGGEFPSKIVSVDPVHFPSWALHIVKIFEAYCEQLQARRSLLFSYTNSVFVFQKITENITERGKKIMKTELN